MTSLAKKHGSWTALGEADWHFTAVAGGVLLYLFGLVCFFPNVITNFDELRYLETAYAFSTGSACIVEVDALSGEVPCRRSGRFLPGTSAVMAPLMLLFGWRGAYLAPALALAVATLCTALWLRAAGRSPLFALMVLGYLPSLVLGRVAMSDTISTMLAALGLWLFWTGGGDRRGRWLASGFVAGLSLSLRETNVLLFAPFYLGALIRRENGIGALILGGLAGSILRPLATWLVFGDPFYVFPAGATFALSHALEALPVYAVALLVLVPAGLIAGLLYRGPRRPEVAITVMAFCLVYLFYGYHGEQSGLVKGLVLGPRYFAPLTPLLAFAAAETLPRLWAQIRARAGAGASGTLDRLTRPAVRLWAGGVIVLAFAIHPAFAHLTRSSEHLRKAIYSHSADNSVIAIDRDSRKLVNPMFGERRRFELRQLTPEVLEQLLARNGTVTVVLHGRADSAYWRQRALENQERVERLMAGAAFELLFEWRGEGLERLRIWRVHPSPK